MTSSATSSGVSPCPHESILTGLKRLSIRRELQLSQNGTGPVPSRKHALLVNTQAFPSRECYKHALVVNTQAFPSRECFKHALVMNTQAFSISSEFIKHALVKTHELSSRESVSSMRFTMWVFEENVSPSEWRDHTCVRLHW